MDIQKVIEGLDKLFAEKRIEKVEAYLSDNLEQALNEGDIGSAITIINELIGFYRDASQYDKAEVYCEKLLPFMERAGLKDTIHYGTSCLNIANAYRAAGRLKDSFNHYQMVFEIYDRVLDKTDFRYASLYNNLSLLYQEMNEFGKACEKLKNALEIVSTYPEAVVETAVTYTNLAASYVKIGELDKAKEASKQGLSIFQNGLTNDYHYSAALAVAGDIRFATEDYEKAVFYYKQAMVALNSHVGMTHAYFRIASNLEKAYVKCGKPDALKGMKLSKDYYEMFGKKAFHKQTKEHKIELSEITFAKVGEGSECFGLDDCLSRDHDFGPGFCVFVTRKQYEEYGLLFEKIYDGLPEHFRGFSKPKMLKGAPRNGVIVIEDFFGRILSLDKEETEYLMKYHTLQDEVWLRLDDWQLRTVTNGEIFDGEDTTFGGMYHNLKKGYPEAIWKRKLAQLLGTICQTGQYNYQRLMLRGDIYGAKLMLHQFCAGVVRFLYFINKQYAPHDKWLMKEAESLEKGQEVLRLVKELMSNQPDEAIYNHSDLVEWIGKTNKEDKILDRINQIAKIITELLKNEGLTESEDIYLECHIPYLLR